MDFPFARIRSLLIDLDGVIYRGNTAIPDAQRFIEWLGTRGVSFRLVTNNATLTPEQYVVKLEHMGIRVNPQDVFTSALATAQYLSEEAGIAPTAYVVGQDGLVDALAAAGVVLTPDDPQWVVVGLDRTLTYEKLSHASLCIERGARFVGSNPDTSFPTERGLEPGAGAILAAIRATTGVQPVIIGKPEPLMLDLAMRALGGNREDTAMLGDRLDTDIAAAQRLDMPSILVLTGVSSEAEIEGSPYQPGLVAHSLTEIMNAWDRTRSLTG
jgi:4-nitrophenyl phosphatase